MPIYYKTVIFQTIRVNPAQAVEVNGKVAIVKIRGGSECIVIAPDIAVFVKQATPAIQLAAGRTDTDFAPLRQLPRHAPTRLPAKMFAGRVEHHLRAAQASLDAVSGNMRGREIDAPQQFA